MRYLLKNINKFPLIIWTSKFSNNNKKLKLLKLGVDIIELPRNKDNLLSLNYGIKDLSRRGFNSVLVEGGSEIYSSLIKNELVDKIYFYRSGAIIGGDGLSSVASYQLKQLNLAKSFNIISTEIIDGGVLELWKK